METDRVSVTDFPQPADSPPSALQLHIQQSLAKTQRAVEIADELFELCLRHAASEDPQLLIHAGTLVGDFANNLRSALNYTARAIIQREVLPKLPPAQQKKLNRKLDFPWATIQMDFEAKPICRAIKSASTPLYERLWCLQPFHPGNEWLAHLMTLSNRDKHIIINNILAPTVSSFLAFLPDGTQLKEPLFVGDKLVIITKDGPVQADLPFYYSPLNAFATPRKTWGIYMVPIHERFRLDLLDYTKTTPLRIIHVLAALESLFDGHAQDKAT
jgi:hypothetical protein